MPKIQLIIEVESAGHLANTLIQMASRYKLEEPKPLEPPPAEAKGNGADPDEVQAPAGTYVAPAKQEQFPKEVEAEEATPPTPPAPIAPPASASAKRSHKKKEPEPPAQPETEPEATPDELPSLDDLKGAITKAVVAEPHGGPIRTALETLRPMLNITLIRHAKEEHRAALWTFVQQHEISLPAQV